MGPKYFWFEAWLQGVAWLTEIFRRVGFPMLPPHPCPMSWGGGKGNMQFAKCSSFSFPHFLNVFWGNCARDLVFQTLTFSLILHHFWDICDVVIFLAFLGPNGPKKWSYFFREHEEQLDRALQGICSIFEIFLKFVFLSKMGSKTDKKCSNQTYR